MQNKINSTKAMVESGIMAAVLVVIMLSSNYIPGLDIVAYVILPTIIALIYVKNGFKYALCSSIIALILGFALINIVTTVLYGAVLIFVGLTLGYFIKNKKKPVNTIIFSSIGFVVVEAIDFFILPLLLFPDGFIGLTNRLVNTVNESLKTVKDMYIAAGISKAQIDQLIPSTFSLSNTKVYEIITPLIIIMAFILAFINYKITEMIFKRMRIEMEERKTFTSFYVPNLLLAFLIIIVCIGLMLQHFNIPIGEYVFIFSWEIFQFILILDAIAYIAYLLRRRFNMAKPLCVLIIILLMIFLNSWFVIIGVVDSTFDLRKLDSNRIKKD
ncbi:DUF2232 domain-containing protein [Clostridium akagii]|uniref:DUF2232 domain-containing protein n=1 Tax=Clostridium akagii TaxID=91623 RepID=UPI00047C1E48|nr:DUF2232 domain-containing protein [Clostridium akagii]